MLTMRGPQSVRLGDMIDWDPLAVEQTKPSNNPTPATRPQGEKSSPKAATVNKGPSR